MSDFSAADFDSFFRELWGFEPFPWQSSLARQVLVPLEGQGKPSSDMTGPWPDAITVPTAAGKTACLDIAVFAQAASFGNGHSVPRRIWFVVDRRVIVDEAYDRAKMLAQKLRESTSGIVAEVAQRLRRLSGGDVPLAAHLLRGGVYRDDAWARSPVQPCVIASTVDQFGSRLLFRAYGRSFKAWPIQAGLAGNDSLVLLDEAHCAQPFLETLQAVTRYRALARQPLSAPFQAVVLSATPPAHVVKCHTIDTNDVQHPVLGPRLAANKPVRLAEPVTGKGKEAAEKFAASLAAEARALLDSDAGRYAVVVFVNRVATAGRVYELLDTKNRNHDLVLLTGRMRPIDKDDTVSGWLSLLSASTSGKRILERPVVVVATQTLEVGANLDFDGLVSECASLDALRQRLGRLNRVGRPIEARAVLIIRADQAEDSADDPVYGPALACTWQWLETVADAERIVNFGMNKLARILPDMAALTDLNAPVRHAPVLLPAHLDALAQTAPVPWPSPDPALFLHGANSGAADIQLCWRLDLDPQHPEQWADAVSLCPPVASECLAVPFGRFRSWFAGISVPDDTGDIEGGASAEEGSRKENTTPRMVLRWLGREEAEVITGPVRLRPGDVVVLPGGDGFDELGHLPPGSCLDHGDRANLESRGKAMLRLHPGPMREWPACPAKERLAALATDVAEREEEPEAWLHELRQTLSELAASQSPGMDWLRMAAASLATDSALGRLLVDHPSGGLVLRGSKRLRPDSDGGFTDEDDPSASGTVRVELLDHLRRVGERARRHGELVGLPEAEKENLGQAGEGHDTGKSDLRFQSWLLSGRPAVGPLLAKSAGLPQHPRAVRRAREWVGYPEGGRHELLSVRLLEKKAGNSAALSELTLHLVASHHGHCRPFAPVVDDPHPVMVAYPEHTNIIAASDTGLERLDSGVPERFWRLTRCYGWWGLAWLEALLRLADHIESAEEQK